MPAGHVDVGELPVAGLIREAIEELGIIIKPKDAQLVHTMYRTKHDETGDRIDLFFVVRKWAKEITNAEPHKCDDIHWFLVDSLPENMMHHVKDAVTNVEKGVLYSELDLGHIVRSPKTP